jgi:heme/copper-type cytochrome/quinol oxidase subunit 3
MKNSMPDKTKVGVGLFILSEAGFFGVLVISYIYFYVLPAHEPGGASSLNVMHTLLFSICLFLSSATIHMAGRGFRRGRSRAVSMWLALAVLLGAVFIASEAVEYRGLLERGITFSTNLFGTTFFTLTGFHGLHVLVGLCALGTLLSATISGRLPNINSSDFEGVSMYWHFVDAVWVVIFTVVYLWPLLER